VDTETKTLLLELCGLCQEALKSASETRAIALRIHEALVRARVPGYLDTHQSILRDSTRLEEAKHRVECLVEDVLSRVRRTI
jgi:hypothetical protein